MAAEHSNDVPYISPLQCYICVQKKAMEIRNIEEEQVETMTMATQQISIKYPPVDILCQGCKIQRYCELRHLVADQEHRTICRELINLQRSQGVEHPLLINGPILKHSQLQPTISQIMMAMRIKLRRRLTRRETELVGYPAYCAVCYKLEDLAACPGCSAIAYCSPKHRFEDLKYHTPEVCQVFAHYYSPYRWLENSMIDITEFDQRCPDLEKSHLVEAFAMATNIHIGMAPWRTLEEYQLFSTCSSFSGIACICSGLTNITFKADPEEYVTIYVVGATQETLNYFQVMHLKFFFLQYQDVCNLDVNLIGHKLARTQERHIDFDFLGLDRKVVLRTFSMTLQEYVVNHKMDPVLIIIYNPDFAGMGNLVQQVMQERYPGTVPPEEVDDFDWRASLSEVLFTYGPPICITSPTKVQARSDMTYVNVLAKEIKVAITPVNNIFSDNPYREILPLHNTCPDDEETIYYTNNYMQVIFTGIKCK